MARLDHSRTNSRDLIRQRGADSMDGSLPDAFRSAPRKGPSKAVLRAELAEAMASVTRIVKCRCGHQAAIALPPSRLKAKLRCSKCGSLASIGKEKPAGRNRRADS